MSQKNWQTHGQPWTLKAIKYLPREQHHTTKLTSWALLVASCFSAGGAPLGFCNHSWVEDTSVGFNSSFYRIPEKVLISPSASWLMWQYCLSGDAYD